MGWSTHVSFTCLTECLVLPLRRFPLQMRRSGDFGSPYAVLDLADIFASKSLRSLSIPLFTDQRRFRARIVLLEPFPLVALYVNLYIQIYVSKSWFYHLFKSFCIAAIILWYTLMVLCSKRALCSD